MARIFLDTNYFIGLANLAPNVEAHVLDEHEGFISTLSCHIMFYVNKIKVPNRAMNSFIDEFNLVEFTKAILAKALKSPTPDLEDNIQLHSAGMCHADYFLTHDKKLLTRKFFGSTRIVPAVSPPR